MRQKFNKNLTSSEGLKYGDRFLYHRNYSERSTSFLKSQFGDSFVDRLSEMQTTEDVWQGPISSKHGYHWIKLLSSSEFRVPSLVEIRGTVRSDYLNSLKEKHQEQRIQELIKKYNIKVEI